MSRHTVRAFMNDDVVDVSIGWDRQLSVFFMDVTKIIDFTDDDECETYEVEEYIYSGNTARNLSLFKTRLDDLSIYVPDDLFSIVDNENKQYVGNSFSFYEISNGALKKVS